MPTTAPATAARLAIKAALDVEFATELPGGFISDKLDESLGWDGNYGAIYPAQEEPQPEHAEVWDATVVVQLYGAYVKKVDPHQVVDPATVENWAERLKRALRTASHGTTQYMWYFNVVLIDYPDDPTGNKSRLEAVIVASSRNSAIWETTG
jgi:hypothetical protein